AEIFLVTYPTRRFRGVVQGIGWGLFQRNGATVDGLPEVAQTLNWVRLAQRFPVRIILDDPDPAYPFRMGQTAVVTILSPRGARSGRRGDPIADESQAGTSSARAPRDQGAGEGPGAPGGDTSALDTSR